MTLAEMEGLLGKPTSDCSPGSLTAVPPPEVDAELEQRELTRCLLESKSKGRGRWFSKTWASDTAVVSILFEKPDRVSFKRYFDVRRTETLLDRLRNCLGF
jgi:hypothetical protein